MRKRNDIAAARGRSKAEVRTLLVGAGTQQPLDPGASLRHRWAASSSPRVNPALATRFRAPRRTPLAVPSLILLGLLVTGSSLEAQIRREGRYWVQTEEGSVPAGGRLRVSSTGSITVRGGASAQQVRYHVTKKVRADNQQEAEQLLREARLTANRQGNVAVIALDNPRCRRCSFSADMTLDVPKDTQETLLETQGGPLDVSNVDGRVRGETAGGPISFRQIGGAVSATTAGGPIVLDAIGGVIRAETAGGPISLNAADRDAVLTTSGGSISAKQVKGTLRAETAGGGISADGVGGDLIAGTSGGSIRLSDVKGSVRASTAGGSIHISSAPSGVRAETAGGDIQLTDVAGAVIAASAAGSIRAQFLAGQKFGASTLETNAGTIAVWLPANVPLTVEAIVDLADSLRHIETEFDSISVTREGSRFGPSMLRARGEISGGGPLLRIRNTSGRIQIRKRP